MLRSWANAESTKYRALLAGPLFFPWACTRAKDNKRPNSNACDAILFSLGKLDYTVSMRANE